MKTFYKTFARTLAAFFVLAGAQTAFAQDAANEPDPYEPIKQLMQKNNCTACHYVDKRKYGPTFLDVAQKYEKADKATLNKLVKKMRAGGGGVWGMDPMPPQPQLSQADAQQMLKLILALKPKAEAKTEIKTQ